MTLPPTLCFAERPWRRDPEDITADADIYQASPIERAALIELALGSGITHIHASHEREAMSLGLSLTSLGARDRVVLSTTDGEALSRCPDTEEGAFQAVLGAISRKKTLLKTQHVDVFYLENINAETHTPARIAGAERALAAALASGDIGAAGATCYTDYDTLASLISHRQLILSHVMARYNFLDRGAEQRLLPTCREHTTSVLASQTYGWLGGVSFTRFPNTWRLRNMTQNFTGHSAGQLHLNWVLNKPGLAGAVISMQTAAQVRENTSAHSIDKVPADIESVFASFTEAITQTDNGWQALLADPEWEVRSAAEAYLAQKEDS